VATPTYAGPNVIINGASVSGVVINSASGNQHAVMASGPNTLTVQNLTVQTTGSTASGFAAYSGATLSTSGCASNAVAGSIFYANLATVFPGNHTFNGSCNSLYWSVSGGRISLVSCTHTFSAPIAVAGASALAELNGVVSSISSTPASFVNASYVNGPKYLADYNGVVDADLLGFSFYPGSTAGSLVNGGQYRP
jgi:hypothetical protein